MIPYDDLVIALTTWRARQGLPVAQLSGALMPQPIAAPAPAPAPMTAAAAPAPGPRTAPPGAPPGGLQARAAAPARPAAAVIEDSLDVEDEAFLEEAQSGGDFALSFDNPGGEPGESTAIGVPPPPRSADGDVADDALPPPPPPRRGGNDW